MKPTVKSVRLFYYDTRSNPAAKTYRELHVVGEEPYWAKPESLDVVVAISGTSNRVDEQVEVAIEELQEPAALLLANQSVLGSKSSQRATWVLHKSRVFRQLALHQKQPTGGEGRVLPDSLRAKL